MEFHVRMNDSPFFKVTSYTGTDFGICAEVIPYLFNHTESFLTQMPPALKDAPPGK